MATILDVARTAGVSPATVSRALNDGTVKQATREKVLRAANKLGYTVNGQVREQTEDAPTNNIAMVVNQLIRFYCPDIIAGTIAQTQTYDYRLMVADAGTPGNTVEELVDHLREDCDGFIPVSCQLSDDDIRRIYPVETTVLANRAVDGYSSVIFDEDEGMLKAIRHLVSYGHTRIAYAAGPEQSWTARRRRASYEKIMAGFDLEPHVLGPFEDGYMGGINAGDAVLLDRSFTAIITYGHNMAAALINRLAERGVQTPRDISVIGADDGLVAQSFSPSISTISPNQEVVGHEAARILIDMLKRQADGEPFVPTTTVIPGAFNVRESTGECPEPHK
ncbi:LacI family DNA-binding transcriptional regulator [Bifidobacterium vespertilionis]|nr:LacI family DNA-binding transcriptional regulator [Bifidobacterium vespertilionis]